MNSSVLQITTARDKRNYHVFFLYIVPICDIILAMKATPRTIADAYELISETLFENLETTGRWEMPWFCLNKRDFNPASGHEFWGLVNTFLLAWFKMERDFSDPRFITAAQARKSNGVYWIKREEMTKGLNLFLPIFAKETTIDGSEVSRLKGFRSYTVYNAEQCERFPELAKPELANHDRIEACEAIVNGMEKRPEIHFGHDRAVYFPSEDKIHMPDLNTFKGAEEFYCTLFHELGHSTKHDNRKVKVERSLEHAEEELVAEITAAILCSTVGIEGKVIDNSKAYVKHWKESCKEDSKLFGKVMRLGLKSAESIYGTAKGPTPEEIN